MFRQLVSLATIAALLTGGCQAGTYERVLMRFEYGKTPEVRKAPYHGRYRLYAGLTRKPTTQADSPLLTTTLRRGDLVGFARDASGHIVAVIRGEQTAFEDATRSAGFTWTVQPDPGQIDRGKTTLLVVVIVVAVVAGVAIGVIASSAPSWGSSSSIAMSAM